MIYHKWDGGMVSRVVDGGTNQCVNCGCILQYVKGKPTYFINDSVYLKAPKCEPTSKNINKTKKD